LKKAILKKVIYKMKITKMEQYIIACDNQGKHWEVHWYAPCVPCYGGKSVVRFQRKYYLV